MMIFFTLCNKVKVPQSFMFKEGLMLKSHHIDLSVCSICICYDCRCVTTLYLQGIGVTQELQTTNKQ